ncbi:3-deoxy-7-phosphoheptulonate synthase, partial [Escherichia coli]|nr:3-deoxy-7-phosphoheptulonate synthase [Escherichia coli]
MQSVSKSIYRGKLLGSLPAVSEIHKEIAVSEETVTWISLQREIIANILLGKDPR